MAVEVTARVTTGTEFDEVEAAVARKYRIQYRVVVWSGSIRERFRRQKTADCGVIIEHFVRPSRTLSERRLRSPCRPSPADLREETMRRKTRGSIGIALAAALSLGVAACGGDDGDSSSTPTRRPHRLAALAVARSSRSPTSQRGKTCPPKPVVSLEPGHRLRTRRRSAEGAWVYVGRSTTVAGLRLITNRVRLLRLTSVMPSKPPTRRTCPRPAGLAGDRRPHRRWQHLHRGNLVRIPGRLCRGRREPSRGLLRVRHRFLERSNLSQFYGSAEDTDYLTGMAAGAASESGKLGIIAAFPIPEVVRGVNAWTDGCTRHQP